MAEGFWSEVLSYMISAMRNIKIMFQKTMEKRLQRANWKSSCTAQTPVSVAKQMFDESAPVFIVSTGRCGSASMQNLFAQFQEIDSYHEAFPVLMMEANKLYSRQDDVQLLNDIFLAARQEIILESFIRNKIFLESNQILSFLIPSVASLFKKARIVHLVRHPGSFIVSAAQKGWYQNDTIWENSRIRMNSIDTWQKLSQIEKLAWYWGKVNGLIDEQAKDNLHSDQYLRVKIEDLSRSESIHQLVRFCGIETGSTKIKMPRVNKRKIIYKNDRENMHRNINIQSYNRWDEEQKGTIRTFVNDLSSEYGYSL